MAIFGIIERALAIRFSHKSQMAPSQIIQLEYSSSNQWRCFVTAIHFDNKIQRIIEILLMQMRRQETGNITEYLSKVQRGIRNKLLWITVL